MPRFLDHNHRAVMHEANALLTFAALLPDGNVELLARQERHPQGIRQIIEIKHIHPLQLGNAMQVGVVGDQPHILGLGQHDQLIVDITHARHVGVVDLDGTAAALLDGAQGIQPPFALGSGEVVGRIG